MIQVTDRGRGGWDDSRHTDNAWVSVKLRDVNDNPPMFHRPHAHITVKENTAPGTLLATLPARDPDRGGQQRVAYHVEGGWGSLAVDSEGGVSLWRRLDRETPDGAVGVARIVGVDAGTPPLSATATLTITVTDVNDCPPHLLPPTTFHVAESAPPTHLGTLTASDRDVWALGHGPPFSLSLASANPPFVHAHVKLEFDPHLDSGRGGAEIWTTRPVDREEYKELKVLVEVTDAGGVSETHALTLVIDDVNDNPMRPASKTVYLWKTEGGGSEAPLGRVFVDDPDDWDVKDKSFRWVGAPHPLFSLSQHTGDIFASTQVREGRYDLQFSVSDHLWGQRGVGANVSVVVRILPLDALAHATPLRLLNTTPEDLTRGWTPMNGQGVLGRLLRGVVGAVGGESSRVEVVSVYGRLPAPGQPKPFSFSDVSSRRPPSEPSSGGPSALQRPPPAPSACVWLSVREEGGAYMDPIKLQGLLELHTRKITEATKLAVLMDECGQASGTWPSGNPFFGPSLPHLLQDQIRDPSSAASLPSTSLPLQVVDVNSTSLVTPRLSASQNCHTHEPEHCVSNTCLNGGRCVRFHTGNRCICPGGSQGPRCKVAARTFSGAGWAWVRAPPSCLPARISLRLLIRRPAGLVFYSGPMAPTPRGPDAPPTPLLALQLWQGRPQLLLEGRGGPLKVELNTTLHNGHWHTLHIQLHSKGVALMLNLCGRGWQEAGHDESRCLARADWRDTEATAATWAWFGHRILQLGGMAHAPPLPDDHGWAAAPTSRPLNGCISHLRFNGQVRPGRLSRAQGRGELVDLGEPAVSEGSVGGCRPQEEACRGTIPGCGRRGRCVGGLEQPECECEPGWSGLGCATPTAPATLGRASYVKVALSFTPAPHVLTLQLRLRSRGARDGLLVLVNTHHEDVGLALHLRAGVVCSSVWGGGREERAACVEGRPVGDGAWHTVWAERHGHNLLVGVDDGDGWRRNESLPVLEDGGGWGPPPPLHVDKNEGITVGGRPEFAGVNLVTVRDDLHDACIEDLRLSGRPLPIPPASNSTTWGQVTTLQHMKSDCTAPDACLNTSCAVPLTCTSTWGQATCSCGPGRELVGRTCKDIDECLRQPCLHGGSCYNMRPGFLCMCGPRHSGHYCEWTNLDSTAYSLTGTLAIVTLTLSLVLVVVISVIVSIRVRRLWLARSREKRTREVDEVEEEPSIMQVKGGTEEGGGGEKQKKGEDQHQAFLECLKIRLPFGQPALRKEGGTSSVILPGGVAIITPNPILPRDDLRAYAYEGDGSSSGSLSSATSSGQRGDEASITKLVPAFLDVMDLLKNLPDATRSPSLHTPHTLPGSRPVRSILKKTEKAQVSSPGPPRALGTSVSPGHVSSVVAQGPRPPADSVYKRSCTESHQDCPGCVSVPLQQSPGCVSEPRHPQDSTTSY
ncbi:putative neural-cadherin 2 [Penaeus vannamei]|uniref:putative neural-cadherin 2 n=1 Tax=Penaeus vannamei TaxID=6689 RepID=UPI00387F6CCD